MKNLEIAALAHAREQAQGSNRFRLQETGTLTWHGLADGWANDLEQKGLKAYPRTSLVSGMDASKRTAWSPMAHKTRVYSIVLQKLLQPTEVDPPPHPATSTSPPSLCT